MFTIHRITQIYSSDRTRTSTRSGRALLRASYDPSLADTTHPATRDGQSGQFQTAPEGGGRLPLTDRRGEHPQRHLAGYVGILQADAYAGFNDLYDPKRKPGPITEAGCWAHGRRKLFDLAQLARAPLAAEAVRRIDAIFDAERTINGLPADQRLDVRKERIAPLVEALEA